MKKFFLALVAMFAITAVASAANYEANDAAIDAAIENAIEVNALVTPPPFPWAHPM